MSRARRVGAYAKLLAGYANDDAVIAAGEKAELLFLRGLAFCADSDQDDYISEAQVVRVVGAGMRDAAARAQKLVEVGLWHRVDGGYLVRSWTKIHETAEEKGRRLKADRERKAQERNPDGQPDHSARIPNGHAPLSSRTDDPLPLDSLSLIQSSSPSENSQGMTAQHVRTLFDAFWSEYPRKVARPDAEKAYAKAVGRESPSVILEAVRRYRLDPNREDAYTAHAATWLNRDGWNDAPVPTKLAPGAQRVVDRKHDPLGSAR